MAGLDREVHSEQDDQAPNLSHDWGLLNTIDLIPQIKDNARTCPTSMTMDQQKQSYLQEMGVQIWLPKAKSAQDNVRHAAIQSKPGNTTPSNTNNWDQLQQAALSCTACKLHQSRTHVVFGVGNKQADLMIVGEAPGYHEDQQGEPFVGRAGQLLNSMIAAIGFERDDIYIANILKCRPPNNRDPEPSEVDLCTKFLTQQIELTKPKAICAVGRIAAQFLLKTNLSLGRLRNKVHIYGELDTPLFVTYHPAYLLRSPDAKRKAYQDLLLVTQTLQKQQK